jgi:hypothetical protein
VSPCRPLIINLVICLKAAWMHGYVCVSQYRAVLCS